MEEKPEAAVTPEVKTEATPNTNPEPAKEQEAPAAPDMHGFTSEQLADMKKFFEANGGFDKVKAKISNPAPAQAEEKPAEPVRPAAPVSAEEPAYKAPAGSITRDEYFTKRYFLDLASEEKYAGIAKEIASGEVLKEMADLGIKAVNQDGSINASVVNSFLELKAKTVPAKQSSAMPEAAAAPTVDYVPVGETIRNAEEARQVIMQDSQLRARGMAGHPAAQKAEEYLRNMLSPEKK
jgi:hypothetical protein